MIGKMVVGLRCDLYCKGAARAVTTACWVKDVCTIRLFEDCEFDSAALRGFEDKVSGDCEVVSHRRERSVWTANQCSRLVFNEEVWKGCGVGGTDYTSYDDALVLVVFLVVIEKSDSHDFVLGEKSGL